MNDLQVQVVFYFTALHLMSFLGLEALLYALKPESEWLTAHLAGTPQAYHACFAHPHKISRPKIYDIEVLVMPPPSQNLWCVLCVSPASLGNNAQTLPAFAICRNMVQAA